MLFPHLSVDHRIDWAGRALVLSLAPDLGRVRGERIEADLDAMSGQMSGSLEEAVTEQEGAVAAHQAIGAVIEQRARIERGRQLPDGGDVALPAQQRRGGQSRVRMAVIDGIEPAGQFGVELVESQFGSIEGGEKLLADRAEEAFDLAASLGLERRSMNDEDAEREAAMRASCGER